MQVYGVFSQTPKDSLLRNPLSDLADFLTHPSLFSLPASIKRVLSKHLRKRGDNVFPSINLLELSVAMESRVLIGPGPKPNAAFPPTPMMP